MNKSHLQPILICLFLGTLTVASGACSHSKTTPPDDGTTDPTAPPPDAATDAVPAANPENPPAADAAATPPAADGAPAADQQAAADSTPPPPDTAATGSTTSDASAGKGSYSVQAGDTLMKIAFETYGDLYKWKDIYQANKDKVSDPNHIPAGTVLKVDAPSTPVTIERNGEKYRIKSGDTLGKIANAVYGTPAKWRKIWKNNKQLIRNPNKIFAGFYLYYEPDATTDVRQPASNAGTAPTSVPPAAAQPTAGGDTTAAPPPPGK